MRRVRPLIVLGLVFAMSAPSWASIIPAGTEDKTTLGNWLGVYGSEGYILPAYDGIGRDRVSLPSYISGYGLTNVTMYVWQANSPSPQGLLDPAGTGNRVEACWYSPDPFVWSVTLTPTETKEFRLGLYMLDPENARTETITLSGAGLTGTDQVGPIFPGTWMVYDVSATAGQDIIVTFNRVGGANAVLSAMTFDPIPEPATLGLLAAGGLLSLRRRMS